MGGICEQISFAAEFKKVKMWWSTCRNRDYEEKERMWATLRNRGVPSTVSASILPASLIIRLSFSFVFDSIFAEKNYHVLFILKSCPQTANVAWYAFCCFISSASMSPVFLIRLWWTEISFWFCMWFDICQFSKITMSCICLFCMYILHVRITFSWVLVHYECTGLESCLM